MEISEQLRRIFKRKLHYDKCQIPEVSRKVPFTSLTEMCKFMNATWAYFEATPKDLVFNEDDFFVDQIGQVFCKREDGQLIRPDIYGMPLVIQYVP